MPADLDDLLRDVSPDPSGVPDVDALWATARRRRRRRTLTGTAAAVAVVVVAGVAFADLAPTRAPVIDDVASQPADPDAADEPAPPADEATDPAPEVDPDAQETAEAEDTTTGDDVTPAEVESEAVPEPDPLVVEDPCAEHAGRELEAFVSVASPVEGQEVGGGELELVGCSNVPEATVRYRLTDADGAVLLDAFTTATCGTGCLGEYRETIALEATGTLTVAVFWDDPSDGEGHAPDVVTVTFSHQ